MASLKRTMILALCLGVPCALAQQDEEDAHSGASRAMRAAIRFYEAGDDLQAMDRFMEILTKGDPAERPMANDYLNLITQRMNTSGGAAGNPAAKSEEPLPVPPAPRGGPPVSEEPPAAPAAPAAAARAPAPARVDPLEEEPRSAPPPMRATRGAEMTAANKSLMRKEIRDRLRAAEDKSLAALRELDGVRIVMRGSGDPAAIGVPAALLFQSGISFQPGAHKLLDPLTRLVFSLGSTQVVILPEGTSLGDAKVLDMRRTMGISAHLYQAGVAPPRVRVNLLNTQVDIPKALLDFKGVVLVFIYDQPMNLTVESAVGD